MLDWAMASLLKRKTNASLQAQNPLHLNPVHNEGQADVTNTYHIVPVKLEE